ncbi:hypothetical protein [Natronococcus sp.]|uniref:hypothetical protein n=1 Tax=Natronococcus sp. TaxID=35747 RepID=UPI003A4D416B
MGHSNERGKRFSTATGEPGSSVGAGLMAVGGSGLFLFAASQLLFSDDPADSVPNSGGIGLAVLGAALVCLGALLQLAG